MLRRLKRSILGRFNYHLKIKGASGPLIIPVINNVGRANLDLHDQHMDVLLERLYTPDTLLIDVGVNIGQTLIKYASVAGRACRYIGFEPNIKAASYVNEIIVSNGMQNAMIVPVGLGSDKRLASLFLASSGATDPGASINENIRDPTFYGAKRIVAVFDGDTALAELEVTSGRIILKIDVEGAELEVLSGLERAIDILRPFVIVEILPPSYFSSTVNDYRLSQAEKLKGLMAEHRYVEYSVGERGDLGKGVSPTNDYLFVPAERMSELM